MMMEREDEESRLEEEHQIKEEHRAQDRESGEGNWRCIDNIMRLIMLTLLGK